jgi:hypothetical protein
MRFRLLVGLFMVAAVIAGCAGPPPTVIYIVISPTPADVTEVASTPSAAPSESSQAVAALPTATVAQPSLTATAQDTNTPTSIPTIAATPLPPTAGPTNLPPGFATPTIAQIQVAEQLFEHGRMFWIGPIDQIWVLKITSTGHGTWSVYKDTFVDGEPENDPSLVPPDGRYQPQRGFGKLWRESPGLRDALGWGVTPEFGYVSRYEYHPGGTVDASGKYIPGPGYHILYSLAGEMFRFNEANDPTQQTWQLGSS